MLFPGQVAGLGAVWLSHKHADHMLGLLGILQARPPSNQPLLVRSHAVHAPLDGLVALPLLTFLIKSCS